MKKAHAKKIMRLEMDLGTQEKARGVAEDTSPSQVKSVLLTHWERRKGRSVQLYEHLHWPNSERLNSFAQYKERARETQNINKNLTHTISKFRAYLFT
ncbi:hypothetical protein AX14_012926 [Amanita brunnescens Koide BX004]|nr:hypothetical protein AX14_012926 [Amanita brunnescens Koide BX004]